MHVAPRARVLVQQGHDERIERACPVRARIDVPRVWGHGAAGEVGMRYVLLPFSALNLCGDENTRLPCALPECLTAFATRPTAESTYWLLSPLNPAVDLLTHSRPAPSLARSTGSLTRTVDRLPHPHSLLAPPHTDYD